MTPGDNEELLIGGTVLEGGDPGEHVTSQWNLTEPSPPFFKIGLYTLDSSFSSSIFVPAGRLQPWTWPCTPSEPGHAGLPPPHPPREPGRYVRAKSRGQRLPHTPSNLLPFSPGSGALIPLRQPADDLR
ncbi:unnamed protein product [Pleuronectes platessa]|uniref:Uncharacterized protein n=1 Tax=Pleuronectes platessa TaxID=8262 RepID=A0A9N7VE32_PLEPL|nr:unnamed protein product [Pleuronectes platessa]